MREREELKIIAIGIHEKHLTMAEDLPLAELDKVFPKLMDMTLRDAAKLIEKNIRAVFQWNCKKGPDGSFDDWEYINQEEWEYIDGFIKTIKTPKPRNPRRKRRQRGNVKKTAKN